MQRDPNALDAAASVASDLVYAACCIIILTAPIIGWIMTP